MIKGTKSNLTTLQKREKLATFGGAYETEFPTGIQVKIEEYDFAPLYYQNERGEYVQSLGRDRKPRESLFFKTNLSEEVEFSTDKGDKVTGVSHPITYAKLTRITTIEVVDEESTEAARKQALKDNENGATWTLKEISDLKKTKNVRLPIYEEAFTLILDDIEAKYRGSIPEEDYPRGNTANARSLRLVNYLVHNKVTLEACFDDNEGNGYQVVNVYNTPHTVEFRRGISYFKMVDHRPGE